MKISPQWIRDFVDLKIDDRKLAEDLTMAGLAVEGIAGEGLSTVFEMEITTNRPDAMNHYGIARECSAIYDVDLKRITARIATSEASASSETFPIIIDDPQGCARYTARIVRNIKVAPSPEHVVQRLQWVEQRAINNAADATNYVIWELGHPTHAFDMDLLEGQKIIVRRARPGEKLTTLDGVERTLSPEDLVIADAVKAVGLAGVMGGLDTMITDRTKNVLIEAAWFDPVSIRKTARRHGLHSDASHRFERGADYGVTPLAADRVAQLIVETGGGTVDPVLIDVIGREVKCAPVQLQRSEVLRILGKEIAEEEVARILRRLEFGVTPGRLASSSTQLSAQDQNAKVGHHAAEELHPGFHLVGAALQAAVAKESPEFTVGIPTWRLDVGREIDVIEEIARIHGYNKFPNTLPEFAGAVIDLPDAHKDAHVRATLLALGYNEAMSLTFIRREETQGFSGSAAVEIANPLSEEAAFMRNSLVPGMLAMIGWNLNHGNNDVRLFEAGNIYERIGDRAEQHKRIALGATGNAEPASWGHKARPYSFFDLKGDVETLLGAFGYRSLYFDALAGDYYHPGRSARAVIDGATVARFGQLHPEVAAARKLRQDVFIGELLLDRLYTHALREPRYQTIPRFPAVDRDFSFVFNDSVNFERIRSAVEALHLPELRSLQPVEIFRGGAIPAGKYSVLLRADFQSAERTLRDEEVALWAAQIIKALEALGGVQRA